MALPHLVILGGGFGAFRLAMGVSTADYDVSIVSPRDHFLFTPLLASTTVGTTEFRSIIEPLRSLESKIKTLVAECVQIDHGAKRVLCRSSTTPNYEFGLDYDLLVIGVGAQAATNSVSGVTEYAVPLKELRDARLIRAKLIEAVERASLPGLDAGERNRLLTFVVVGGGPTGVEFAGELHDFTQQDLKRHFPEVVPYVRIILVEAGPNLLTTFDRRLSEYTKRIFSGRNIEIYSSSYVEKVERESVVLRGGTTIKFGLLVWSAGVAPTNLIRDLTWPKDRFGRLVTDEFLRVPTCRDVYAIGDCASVGTNDYPMTGQLAMQQGRYLALAFRKLARHGVLAPFVYKHLGMLAYIGGHKALADTPGLKWRGFFAWILWRSIYITKLVSVRNKLRVLFDWIRTSIYGRDIAKF